MTGKELPKSSNFGFLAKRYPQLERIGARGERYFSDDPVITLISVRQFGEVLARISGRAFRTTFRCERNTG